MPKRSGKPNSDPNVSAFSVVAKLTGSEVEPVEPPAPPAKKNPAAVMLGRLGGKKGGAARARNLTPEQLSEIGRKGAAKRWSTPKE